MFHAREMWSICVYVECLSPQPMQHWRHYVLSCSSRLLSVRAKIFLSLCKKTEWILMIFTGGNHYHEQIKSLHFGRNWNRLRDVNRLCGDVRQVLLGLGRWCLTVLLDLGRECLTVLLTGRLYALSHQWLRRMKCVKHTVPRWWDWVQILCFLRATFQDATQLPHTHLLKLQSNVNTTLKQVILDAANLAPRPW